MNEQQIAACFARDTANHTIKVRHDDGLYRHLRFDNYGSSFYHFELITWPGYLTICGDMGSFTFRRITDMFRFFSGSGQIDFRYWAEKLQASSDEAREFSLATLKRAVHEHIDDMAEWGPEADDWEARRSEADDALFGVESEVEAYAALRDLTFVGDICDLSRHEWGFRFVWCCYAIRWGIEQYVAQGGQISAVAE